MFVFKSWIPNVVGYLSFGLIGKSDSRDPFSLGRSKGANDAERVVVLQRRHLSDSNFLFLRLLRSFRNFYIWLADTRERKYGNRDKLSWFLFDGVINSTKDRLDGKVYVFKRPTSNIDNYGINFSKLYQILYSQNLTQGDEISNLDLLDVGEAFKAFGVIKADVSILRNGEVELNVSSIDRYSSKIDYKTSRLYAFHMYTFLRDAFHNHYHHDTDCDDLISVHNAEDGTNWRKQVYKDLIRFVHKLRRTGRFEDMADAMGTLAYVKSFNKIFLSDEIDKKFVENTDLANLEASILALREKSTKSYDQHRDRTIFWFSFFAAILGVFLAGGQLVEKGDLPNGHFWKDIFSAIKDYPISFVFCVVTILCFFKPIVHFVGHGRSYGQERYTAGWIRTLKILLIASLSQVKRLHRKNSRVALAISIAMAGLLFIIIAIIMLYFSPELIFRR